jgi:hypothetical protein
MLTGYVSKICYFWDHWIKIKEFAFIHLSSKIEKNKLEHFLLVTFYFTARTFCFLDWVIFTTTNPRD